MCQDCGCSLINNIVPQADQHQHQHKIDINQGILSKNERLAKSNRSYFKSKGLLVINLLSSPGSGKTALIEKMLQNYGDSWKIGVIVGDLATDNDARRLQSKGAPTVQITTGNACHLEAAMIARAAAKLDLDDLDLLVIENLGNLVCPAAYDLGEDLRAVLLSVTEGEDKPLKYPIMFKSAQIVVINKIDLAEAVEFEREKAIANIQKIAPQAQIFEVSAKNGQGINALHTYLFSLNCLY
ncbi:hydrogenase accessory protein HypB [Xenococcus sp. PCC 7305]|uniref:hydrogenase nickel incorporation protein HypB n=1 Tax=Xenococcus sp. PCC 7305 TaxID=102125 RepID=UPI0002ABF5C6|nr:hydrogenase nickel incorporation protein HypB [Xenococcus sp. PCC 7305]ELS00782.1 hydrogenase accessory protein HypB [Xenococcus sp. PCC 7305]